VDVDLGGGDDSWPSHSEMTVVSTPALRSRIAKATHDVWRDLLRGQGGTLSGGLGEVGDDRAVEAFGWYCQHSGDDGGVFRVAQRGVAEQGVDRGEAGIAVRWSA
jgi:hypothetical protein